MEYEIQIHVSFAIIRSSSCQTTLLQTTNKLAKDFYETVSDNYGIDYCGPSLLESDQSIVVPQVDIQLTDAGLEELQQVNVQQH